VTSADLCVLGAGPAGIGVAYRGARSGYSVVVLERGDRIGGASASFEVGGQRVDLGSHRLHPSIDPLILADLRSLLGPDLQRRVRRGRIRLAGRWISFPLKSSDLVRHLPRPILLGAARDALTSWARRPRADSFAEVIRAGLGPTMSERFYAPYARKLWGLDPDLISGEQARRRVAVANPVAMIRRVLGGARREPRDFLYPRRGFGQIVEALEEAAVGAGAEIRVGTSASSLESSRGRVIVKTSEGEEVEAGRIFSTIPVTALARMVEPGPPKEVKAAAESLHFRSMLLVYLVLDRARYTGYDAHYLPEAWTPVTRISEPKNYRDGDDPPNRTVLCAEVPCAPGDALLSGDRKTLEEIVCETLVRAELPHAPVVDVSVRALTHAYPVYSLGYARAFDVLDHWATELDRVVTLGRQGLFVHDNSHHAYAMAWAAADALGPDGSFDNDVWTRARDRFTGHVVED
jgi:protoporphyrinogen oxidase